MEYYNPTVSKQAKPRKGYRGRLTYMDDAGKRHEVSKSFNCRTLSEAKRMLAKWHAEMNEAAEREAEAEATGSTRPLVDLVQEHIDRSVNVGNIERSTLISYNSALRNIRKGFGDLPVRDLTREMVEKWEEGMTASGLSSSSVGKAHRLLKMVLNRAVESGLIERNPVALVKPPKRKAVKEGINALAKPERARLVALLGSMDPCPISVAAMIALHTGMRRGEICALRWQDVDLDSGVLWVKRSVGIAKGGPYIKESKTGRSRDVALTPTLVSKLKEWRAVQAPGCTYVIGDPLGFADPQLLTKEWTMFARQFNVRGIEGRHCTFHDLRHTWATAAVAAGIDIKTVSSNLGHANAAMTLNIYASADPEAKRRAAEVMDGVI